MALEIQQNSSLASLNTLGLDVIAEYLVAVHSEDDVREAMAFAAERDCTVTVLGSGSNVVFKGPVSGLVMVMCIPGVLFDGECVEAAAGENWHNLVLASMEQGLSGLENLALIPGSVGAAPIQNIGAYGVELDSIFTSLMAIDRSSLETLELSASDCKFGYRDSVFKHELRDQLIITSVRLELSREFRPNLSYQELEQEIGRASEELSPQLVAETVCRIRSRKLPDPAVIGNAGSFFKNPEVSTDKLAEVQSVYPNVPHWQTANGSKLAAAWLIEQCGLKGHRVGGAAISGDHALVVVNAGGATGTDVMALAAEVQGRVSDRFDLALEIEPTII